MTASLAHIEWCNPWETGIPRGVSSQADKQILLNGYPGVLWGDPVAAAATTKGGDTGTEYDNWRAKEHRRRLKAIQRDDDEVVAIIIAKMLDV